MELDLLDKKIRRLVCKLKKHNIDLEVFDHRDIEYGEVLGKGGEGIVQQCTVIYNDMPIDAAIKTLQDNSDDAISITLDEIELLCLARDHVIDTTLHVYGVAAVPDRDDEEMGKLVIITEAGIMNALQLYQKEEVPLWVTYDLWSRIAAAVNTMHMRHIVHQDLKPENILVMDVVRDIAGQIRKIKFKVIDLGMGKRVFTEKIISEDILGTNGYHAPEVLTDECYDFRADIFTLGITFCVMLQSPDFLKSGKLQMFLKQLHAAKKRGMTGKKLYQEIIEPRLPENKEVPSSIRSMIWRMLEKQEKRKITLVEVMNTCRIEAICAKQDARHEPQQLSPCTNSTDSGISSISHRDPPSSNPSTATSRRSSRPPSRTSRASRSRTSSTSSTNTSTDTTPISPLSKTRRPKRKALDVESIPDLLEFTPIAKRLRGLNSPIARRLRRFNSTLS